MNVNLHGEPPFDLLKLCQLRLGLLVVGDGLDAAVVPHRSDPRVHNTPGGRNPVRSEFCKHHLRRFPTDRSIHKTCMAMAANQS